MRHPVHLPAPPPPADALIRIHVGEADFDPNAELAALRHGHQTGAQALFIGLVRDFGDTDGVTAITLEHYPGMTEAALTAIAREAAQRWHLHAVSIHHRTGRMKVGERIVLVATAAAHRQAAFESCQYIMDILKTRAPFWKKEHRADGSEHWVNARPGDELAAERWLRADSSPSGKIG